jgi:hypothetical protein
VAGFCCRSCCCYPCACGPNTHRRDVPRQGRRQRAQGAGGDSSQVRPDHAGVGGPGQGGGAPTRLEGQPAGIAILQPALGEPLCPSGWGHVGTTIGWASCCICTVRRSGLLLCAWQVVCTTFRNWHRINLTPHSEILCPGRLGTDASVVASTRLAAMFQGTMQTQSPHQQAARSQMAEVRCWASCLRSALHTFRITFDCKDE